MEINRCSYPMPGGTISAVHFNADKGPVRLVFAHATGFNGLTYRAILQSLGVHAVAIDQRGHGFTDLLTDINGLKNWDVFADDLAVFIGRYIPGKIVLSGHSFGAVACVLASEILGARIAGYAGLDPVSMPWLGRQWPHIPGGRAFMKKHIPIARNAGNRRSVFDSQQAAFDRYKGRGGFKNVADETLQDYLAGGLKPHADGVQLTCDPKWEQAVFCAQAHNLYKAANFLPANSRFCYAGGKAAVSTPGTRAKIGQVMGKDKVYFEPEISHLFPIQNPDYVIRQLSETLKGADWE